MNDDFFPFYAREWLHLAAGVKRAAVIPAHEKHLSAIKSAIEGKGFAAKIVSNDMLKARSVPAQGGYVMAGVDETAVKNILSLYLSEREAQADGQAYEAITEALVQLLGYPECCLRAFERLPNKDDVYLTRASFYRTIGKIHPLLITLPAPAPSLLLHAPHALDCEASIEIAETVLQTAQRLAPVFAEEIETASLLPIFFLDNRRYLRLKGYQERDDGFSFNGIHLTALEEKNLDEDFYRRFLEGGRAHKLETGAWMLESSTGDEVFHHPSHHHVMPLVIEPNAPAIREAPLRVALIETLPNERPQMLSSFFPELYSADLQENGIEALRIVMHMSDNDAIQAETEARAEEALASFGVCQPYFFRAYAKAFAKRLQENGHKTTLIENAMPKDAHEMDSFLPILERADFIRHILLCSTQKQSPYETLNQPTRESLWTICPKPNTTAPFIDPEIGFIQAAKPFFANPRIKPLNNAYIEILAQPGCPYRASAKANPVYQNIDLSNTAFARGCAFCTARTPFKRALKKETLIQSLVLQAQRKLDGTSGAQTIRLLDQAPLPFLESLIRAIAEKCTRRITWLLDLRVSDILNGEAYLRGALASAKKVGHRIDAFCIGFENFSDAELLRFNKGATAAQNKAAITLLDRLGKEFPETLANTSPAAGFVCFTPWTTLADLAQNAEAITKLDFTRFRSKTIFTKLRLYPETPLYALAAKEGLLLDAYDDPRLDASGKFGYSPEAAWRFKDEEAAKAYKLLIELEPHQGRIDEGGLLAHVIKAVQSNQSFDSFLEQAKAFLLPDEMEAYDAPDNAKPRRDIDPKLLDNIEAQKAQIANHEDSFNNRMALAQCYVAIQKPEDALQHFLVARKKNPHHPDPLLRIAEMLLLLRRTKEAQAILNQCKTLFQEKAVHKSIKALENKIP